MKGKQYLIISVFVIIFMMLTFNFSYLSAHPSWGIVVGKNRTVYFADLFHNERGSVWKLSKDGHLELLLSDFHAHNVSLDASGNLVTAHGEGDHTMIRIKTDGSMDTLYHTLDHNQFFGGNCTFSIQGEIIFGIEKFIWKIKFIPITCK